MYNDDDYYLHEPSGVIYKASEFRNKCGFTQDFSEDPLFLRAIGMPSDVDIDSPFVTVTFDREKTIFDKDNRTITIVCTTTEMSEEERQKQFAFMKSHIAGRMANYIADQSVATFNITLPKDVKEHPDQELVYSVLSDISRLIQLFGLGKVIRQIQEHDAVNALLNNRNTAVLVSQADECYYQAIESRRDALATQIGDMLKTTHLPVTLRNTATEENFIYVFSDDDLFCLLSIYMGIVHHAKSHLITIWEHICDETIDFAVRYKQASNLCADIFSNNDVPAIVIQKDLEARNLL